MCTDAANEHAQIKRKKIVKVLAEMVPKPRYVTIFLGLAQRLV